MQKIDTGFPKENAKTTARGAVGVKPLLTIAAPALIAAEPALAQQTSSSAVCSVDNPLRRDNA